MDRAVDATQLLDLGSWCAIVGWSGLVLVGLAILVTLLDWGELSGFVDRRPPRRGWARGLALTGTVLMVGAGLEALVLS